VLSAFVNVVHFGVLLRRVRRCLISGCLSITRVKHPLCASLPTYNLLRYLEENTNYIALELLLLDVSNPACSEAANPPQHGASAMCTMPSSNNRSRRRPSL
jgi:hypothetical protein